MTLWVLLAAAVMAAGNENSAEGHMKALIEDFVGICMKGDVSLPRLNDSAAAAGFRPVPLTPSEAESRETAAWEKNGIRLFSTAAQTDPRWPLTPACNISADVGRQRSNKKLLNKVLRGLKDAGQPIALVFGQVGIDVSSWLLTGDRDRWNVQLFTDRTRPDHAVIWLRRDILPEPQAGPQEED